MRVRVDIDYRKMKRITDRYADQAASRAASISQMRVKEGITLTDRIRTGKMLNRVHVREVGRARYQVRSEEFYAGWQEFGRGPVRPVRAKFLRFKPKGSNNFIFTKYSRPDPGGHFYLRALARLRSSDFVP